MKQLGKPLLTVLLPAVTAICFFISPYGRYAEEEYGLTLLFTLRGSRPPPEKAVIVNIDADSTDRPGLSPHFSKWPRTVHADLVDRLVEFGAKLIVFDVLFAEEKDPESDLAFAAALQRAGNVILVEELRHTSLSASSAADNSFEIEVEQLVPPIEILANTALALAPFPLPKIPVRVTRTWRFKSTCGEIPTLPATAFQAANPESYNELHRLLHLYYPEMAAQLPLTAEQVVSARELTETMRRVRCLFLENPGLSKELFALAEGNSALPANTRPTDDNLAALITMYGEQDSSAIDFYGPPFTIRTLSLDQVLTDDSTRHHALGETFKDKAVFVGAARDNWSNQKDGFYTVFSQPDGLDISGVELAATIYSNLAENRAIQALPHGLSLCLIVLSALAVALLCSLLSPLFSSILLLAGVGVSLSIAQFLFGLNGTWIPIITLLLLIPAITFITATLVNYVTARRQYRNVSTALGFYLPDNAVEELSRDLSFINKGEQMVYSTCLITDAQHYTALSERMRPAELSRHMKEYYQMIFTEVKKKEGIVCNIIGDSMLAHWPSPAPDATHSTKACQAALRIADTVQQFNRRHGKSGLPTRIGLHSGYVLMDNIGAEDHYEYAPVGDIINTVSRIEGLNKHLSTRILASAEVIGEAEDIVSREIGSFLFGGKNQAITIFEILTKEQRNPGRDRLYSHAFPWALSLFRDGKWQEALAAFKRCLILDGGDGPSLFYINLCQSYLIQPPPPDRQGDIAVEK
jgi:adenylate cyclase